MTKVLNREYLALGFLIAFLAFCILLTRTQAFLLDSSNLSMALTLDLLITLPLVYFLLIRKSRIPVYTCFSVFILGIITASYIIPEEHSSILDLFKSYALPIIELTVIAVVLFKLWSVRKTFNTKTLNLDFYDNLKSACKESLPPKIDALMANEVAVFYYLFKTEVPKKKDSQFTYHKKSGTKLIVSVLLFLIAIETVVMHILLHQWKPTVAWVATFLSIYTCLQIFSYLRSMNKRLIEIDEERSQLKLRAGYFNESNIALNNIDKIEMSQRTLNKADGFIKLSPLDMIDSHNVIIHLNEEETLYKMYGFKKEYQSIGVFLDEPKKFVESIQSKTNSDQIS